MKTKQIRIDSDVFFQLQQIAIKENKPFTSVNNVLRYALNIDTELKEGKR